MAKEAKKYLEENPYKLIEKGFHIDRAMASESLFSISNEYSGIRAFFDEGYSGKRLQGVYFNGIYEYAKSDTPSAYLGIVKRTHFTINSVNWVKTKIEAFNEVLDLNKAKFTNFYRELNFNSGLYERSFNWLVNGCIINITFKRLLNMTYCHEALQQITFKANKDVKINLELSLDSNVLHWGSDCYWEGVNNFTDNDILGISVKTPTTNQSLVSAMKIDLDGAKVINKDKEITACYSLDLKENKELKINRYVINIVDKKSKENVKKMIDEARKEVVSLAKKGFDKSILENKAFFKNIFENSDVEIGGSISDQQGIRFCIFNLAQTYHGYAKDNNIGAKGLTGEAYSGHAFWDSETYCLPYYLFSNKEAAKNLLMFRYETLEEAKLRAKDLDCEGACYPVATRNGKEGCNLWQHASLQFQPSTAVFYAINHYMNLYNDKEFFQNYGLEMIAEIAKFLLSRGQYNQDKTKFSFYSVMGPDEFKMMVNHNVYTNYMAKKTFDYLIDIIDKKEYDKSVLFNKCGYTKELIEKLKDASAKMIILYDRNKLLFEQNEGFFDLPHIDINSIPADEFPLYSHWSYDRIYRNDMIKQPDILMMMFLYNQDFTKEQKIKNYEYYEPRCIHESSLSPSIHSILATEIGKYQDSYKFFKFATRLDLDDYNNNTCEGIHTTSIAAAWMNIVYGFGGLRSDRKKLLLNPVILDNWDYYSFKINYHDSIIKVYVDKKNIKINSTKEVDLTIRGKDYKIKNKLVLEY